MITRLIPVLLIVAGAFAASKMAKAQIADVKNQEPLASLAGSEWGPENGMGQFVLFMSNGDLAGFAGCNNFFGTYEQDGQTITIGPLAMTKKMCPENMGAEQAFIAALESARTFEATFLEINILDENEEVALSMRRRDWD